MKRDAWREKKRRTIAGIEGLYMPLPGLIGSSERFLKYCGACEPRKTLVTKIFFRAFRVVKNRKVLENEESEMTKNAKW